MPGARTAIAACAALLLAAAGAAGAKDRVPPFPQGLYGDVTFGKESGDLGGFEARFYRDPASGRQMVEFTLCEGWCNIAYTAEVRRDGDGFVFGDVEVLERSDAAREEHQVRYRVVPDGRRLKVFYSHDGQDFTGDPPWRIKPLKKPYGLTVARERR